MFNIRVYGILITEENKVLVSDEFIRGNYLTKLPGGGLEFGEGTRDCLVREFKEETGLDVTIGDHIYTTDFYQPSAFRVGDQILSIYIDEDGGRPAALIAGFDPLLVDKVVGLVDRAEYKRRQYPPGTKISSRAFGKDRRLPITSHWRES